MTDDTDTPPAGAAYPHVPPRRRRDTSRSGSATRQRSSPVTFRATAAERAEIEAAADRAGLTASSYVRAQALAKPKMRAMRVPPVNKAALAQLLGQVGRVGSNVNQIARQLNSGADEEKIADLAETLKAVREMRDALLLTLGMKADTKAHPVTVEPI